MTKGPWDEVGSWGRKGKGRERDRMGPHVGEEEESVYEETRVIGLLPGRKKFVEPCSEYKISYCSFLY